MDRLGFIHEKLDIKLLILYILRRLPWYVDMDTLTDLCQCDGGVGYFDYSDCLNDLIDIGHVENSEYGLRITAKGAKNIEAVESSLPYSVRLKADKELEPVRERLSRASMLNARHEMTDVGCTVFLSMEDGLGKVIELNMLCADENQAALIEKNFRRDAEKYYQKIIAMLSEEKKK